jgi:hypothetical protein
MEQLGWRVWCVHERSELRHLVLMLKCSCVVLR